LSRLLLVDDHPMISTALEALLRNTPFKIVGVAATGEEAIDAIGRLEPEFVLLDLQLRQGSGMDVLRQLRREQNRMRVVLLTAAIDDSSLMEAKALHVQGIVLKNSDPAYLFECLDRVRRGGQWFDPEVTERFKRLSDSIGHGEHAALAPRERELIKLVRNGLRNREIAQKLGVTEGTIKVYLHTVFQKLGVSSRTELAIRASEFLTKSYMTTEGGKRPS
jgi:Response regulator containing a CheY-like receiver domain and an HTH DNA-binding domain